MRNMWTIAKREYKLYFSGPIAYAVAFLYLLILGILIYAQLRDALEQAYFQPYTPTVQVVTGAITVYLLIFTTPVITMRLLAEEARSGTMELLLTAPVRDWELVLGKWLSGFLFMVTLLLVTLIYPLVLNQMTSPGIDYGPLVTGYLGLLLMASSLVAVGVGISSFFNNQVPAFFVTLMIMLALWFIPMLAPMSGAMKDVLDYLGFIQHYLGFFRGVIDIKDVAYYISLTALGLFLGVAAVEMRRWR